MTKKPKLVINQSQKNLLDDEFQMLKWRRKQGYSLTLPELIVLAFIDNIEIVVSEETTNEPD